MNEHSQRFEPLWTSLGLVAPLQARIAGGLPSQGVRGVSIDTRTLRPGDLFFAIAGESNDGHDFVRAAFEAGAAAAVVSEARASAFAGVGPLFVVHDVLAAMVRLGRAARARSKARVVAVTGSVGKTSTKEALRLVLGEQGSAHAAAASYNNHIGVPLTLSRMPGDTEFGVFEIGMNHAGEIAPLSEMVRPHVAIITTIGPVHIEHLGSMAAIADAKAEIFAGLDPGGIAVIHRDVPEFAQLRDHAEASAAGSIISFGEDAAADAQLIDAVLTEHHSDVIASIGGETIRYRVGAPGKHLVVNSLAVLAAARALGADLRRAAASLAQLSQPAGRGARLRLVAPDGPFTLIDESYNANPMSMRAALALLGHSPPDWPGRRIAVLGDMLELGDDAPQMHADLAKAVADSAADVVFAAGPLMKRLFDAIPDERRGEWGARAADIENAVLETVSSGDVVMVKGSNGSRMFSLVAALKRRFPAPDDQA